MRPHALIRYRSRYRLHGYNVYDYLQHRNDQREQNGRHRDNRQTMSDLVTCDDQMGVKRPD